MDDNTVPYQAVSIDQLTTEYLYEKRYAEEIFRTFFIEDEQF